MTTSAIPPDRGSTSGPRARPGPEVNAGGGRPRRFAADHETAIEHVGPGRWRAFITADWNINANPNGGYALTPLLRAMAAEVEQPDDRPSGSADGSRHPIAGPHPDPVSSTTHFARPALADRPAELIVEVLRRGRRTSTVRGSMIQDGKPRLESIATFADLAAGHAESEFKGFRIGLEPPDLPPPEECHSRLLMSHGSELPLLSRIEARIDPRYTEPGRSGEAVTAGWVRFLDGRQPDSLTLPMFADCFPPSIFGLVGRTGWVPTIELTVHVRRRPAPGWVRGRFTTEEIAGSMLVEDGVLWDSTDRVVARARQLAMVTD